MIGITVWERRLLRRLDRAVLAIWRSDRPTPTQDADQGIPVGNPKAVRQLVRGVLAQKRARAAQQSQSNQEA